MASQNCWLLWLRTTSILYTQHVGALQWAALLVYRGLCCSLWFWLGYFGENVTWHARVTPLAMGGWGNAIMLRPINCYLWRQTDFKKKLSCLLCYVATICLCHDLSQTHGKSPQNFFPIIFQMFFFCLFALHGSSLELCFLTSWPALTSDPPDTNEAFSQFSPKTNPSRLAAVCERLRPAAHQTLWESTGPNVLSIIIGYWKCS